MSEEEEKPEDVHYILTNTRCYHPFFGDARLLLDVENHKYALLFTLHEASLSQWWFDERYNFVILENLKVLDDGFVKLKETDTSGGNSTEYVLSRCDVDERYYPIFSYGRHVLFYGDDDAELFIRFDGIASDPYQRYGEYDAPLGEDAEKWFTGAEYLQVPSRRLPSPLINFGKTTISLYNYRDPTGRTDFTEEYEYELEIDTSMLAAWGKEEGRDDEEFCGEYVGLGTNINKKYRLGYGEWMEENTEERLFESKKKQEDGSLLIDGLTLSTEEDAFIYVDKDVDDGYWRTGRTDVKLGQAIILSYVQTGNNAEPQPDKIFVWQGYTWYKPKKIIDKNGNKRTVNAPLYTKKINAMDAPVWR